MNEQDFGERFNTSDSVERTDQDTNSPDVNSDPLPDNIPMDADLIHETAMGETEVHETPMGETIVQEASIEETVVHETPMVETITHEAPNSTNAGASASLLNREESENFRTRWNEIQGKFVDEPRSAVEKADELVTEVIELITEMFNNEHRSLEAQWNKGNDVSTEDLRIALQRYRSFFNSLVV
jgi:hypothetical protein